MNKVLILFVLIGCAAAAAAQNQQNWFFSKNMTHEDWLNSVKILQSTYDDSEEEEDLIYVPKHMTIIGNSIFYNSQMIDDMGHKIQGNALYYRDIILAKINEAKESSSSEIKYDQCFKNRTRKGYPTDGVHRLVLSMLQKMKEINTKQSLEEYQNDLDLLEDQTNGTLNKILKNFFKCMKNEILDYNIRNIRDNVQYYRQLINDDVDNYERSSNSSLDNSQCYKLKDMLYPNYDVYDNAKSEFLSMPDTNEGQLSEAQKKYIFDFELKVNNTLIDIKNNGLDCIKNLEKKAM